MSGSPETPSELLEAAEEHENRADTLRREARESVKQEIREQLDFEATVTTQHSGDGFVVEVIPTSLSEVSLDDEELGVSVRPATLAVGAIDVDPDAVRDIKDLIDEIGQIHETEPRAPRDAIVRNASAVGLTPEKAKRELEQLRTRGEIYEPQSGYYRTT